MENILTEMVKKARLILPYHNLQKRNKNEKKKKKTKPLLFRIILVSSVSKKVFLRKEN